MIDHLIGPLIVFLLGLAPVAWGYVQQRKYDAMHATPTLGCAEIAAGGRLVTCEVKGTAVPGPQGTVQAPFSERPCVWFRAKVTVRYEHHEHRDGRRRTTTREKTVHDETHGSPFGIQDAGGQILVMHDRHPVDGAPRTVSHFEPAGHDVNLFGLHLRVNLSNVKGHRYEEWIVPAGQPMYALGAAGPDGDRLVMRRPADDPFIISARSEEELSKSLRINFYAGYILGGALIAGSLIWLAIKTING